MNKPLHLLDGPATMERRCGCVYEALSPTVRGQLVVRLVWGCDPPEPLELVMREEGIKFDQDDWKFSPLARALLSLEKRD